MTGKKISIGVLGCANIAKRSVIPEIISNNYFELFGVASRTESKAKEFASVFNTKPFVGYDSLLNEKKIEAVYVPLPCGLHYEWINKALDQGLHVISEKSLACTEEEVISLIEKAINKKLVLLENFQFRFHKQFSEILRIINEKTLGEIKFIRSSFCFPPFKNIDDIRHKKELGGGALLDAGAYTIKISNLILGNEVTVITAFSDFDTKMQIDKGGGGCIIQSNGKAYSEISFGFDHFYQCNLEIIFSKGKVTSNRIFTAPPGYEADLIIESEGGKKDVIYFNDNHFKNILDHFHDLIKSPSKREEEYRQNVIQAKLIQQFRDLCIKL